MYPNVENMIAVAITKRMENITSVQVCLISRININYKEWWKEKLFLLVQAINIVYPNMENMIVVTITKRKRIITSFQIYLISQININYKENGRGKSFPGKSKPSISCTLLRRT